MNSDFANKQALLLFQNGQVAAALSLLDKVLEQLPFAIESLLLKGRLLQASKRLGEALICFDRAATIRPNSAEVLNDRGAILNAMGRPKEALLSFDRALTVMPHSAVILYNRGNALRALDRETEAIANYDRALKVDPRLLQAWNNHGAALHKLNRYGEAVASFDRAIAIHSGVAEFWHNRGNALSQMGRQEEALQSYDQALALADDLADAWDNRGVLLREMKRHADALASHDRAVAIKPDQRLFWTNRGIVLRELKRISEALESLTKALEIDPNHAETLSMRGMLSWIEARDYDSAVRDLERAVHLDPDCTYAAGWLLLVKQYGGDWADYDANVTLINVGVKAGKTVVDPFVYQAVSHSPADLMESSMIHAQRFPKTPAIVQRPARASGKIRLGYVSGEFREQATAHLMAGVYEHHDKEKFEIVAFDNGFDDQSPIRKRLIAAFDKFVSIAGLSDGAAARAVASENIDILINLNGYFGEYRMGVFAQRPAPIQVNYLGFPATLGATYIDYILADAVVIPAEERRFYSEKVLYLPHTYQANDSRRPLVENVPDRMESELPPNSFVFCNFNAAYKLTPATFSSWMRIVKQVPDSILWLLEGHHRFSVNLRKEAESRGVSGDRIIMAPFLPLAAHIARLSLADLVLDSLPYNAHTTAADALWAGVPVITQIGTTFPGRVGASILGAINLPELVTNTQADFESTAIRLAMNKPLLQSLRQKLADNRTTAPLFNTASFTKHIETAYQTMFENSGIGNVHKAPNFMG